MNTIPADPYIRNSNGAAIGHYSSEALPGGRGNLHVGMAYTATWMGRDFRAEVVGYESQGTNNHHRVIVRYWH